VYLSVVLRPRVPATALAPLALVVGVAVARVVEARLAGVAPVWTKWPNDVLAGAAPSDPPIRHAKKLAGVLVEGQLRGAEVASVVVGVGLDVAGHAFPPDLAARATSLALLGVRGLDRDEIAAELVAGILTAADRHAESRLESFLPELERRDALRGAHVEVAGVRGVARGVDPSGQLRVEVAAGQVQLVASGEVVLLDGHA
jgi:BirA family biotin operon repressor/biotin-[acetyl-CoA-carboxylase] ligase